MVALAGMSTIAHRPTELLEGHITRTPSRVPDIPIYGMGYNDMCFPALYSPLTPACAYLVAGRSTERCK